MARAQMHQLAKFCSTCNALSALKNALNDPTGVLTSWDASLVNPCTWFHITCNNDKSVTRVDLGNANLTGQLVPELGQLPNLEYLELYSNNINGTIPAELGNLTNLVSLDLYQNKLSGPMPDSLGKLSKMRFLRLNNNILSGAIPLSLTNVSSLQVLDLSKNNLSGEIPVNGSFSLFTPVSFKDNPYLKNNFPTPNPPSTPGREGTKLYIAAGVGAAFFFCFVFVLSLGVNTSTWKHPNSSVGRSMRHRDPFIGVPAAEEEHKTLHLQQLTRFSLRELMVATDNFNRKNVLGRGGFGKVYKGRLADGSLVAVKRLKEERSTQGGELQFQTELEMISMAVHCNLLRLKGYCITPKERLLVYPYMVNGSVASCLRERKESQPPLDWPKRKQIALGTARGLTYLHEQCNPKIIHRDIKAANTLLDEEFEAVVGDFGLAKLMDYQDTHINCYRSLWYIWAHITRIPLHGGKSSEKSDVFAYGVMLLELVTGQQAFDLARLTNNDEVMLLNRVKLFLKDNKLVLLVDKDLQGKNCTQEEVEELIKIALLCTQSSPMERPKMSEVVRMLEGEGLAERWEVLHKDPDVFRLELHHAHLPNTSTDHL